MDVVSDNFFCNFFFVTKRVDNDESLEFKNIFLEYEKLVLKAP